MRKELIVFLITPLNKKTPRKRSKNDEMASRTLNLPGGEQ